MTGEESMRHRSQYLFWARIYWPVGRCATCQCPAIDPCGRLKNLHHASCLRALIRSDARALRIAVTTTAKLQALPCFSCSPCAAGILQRLSIPTSSLLPPSRWLFATANPPPPSQRCARRHTLAFLFWHSFPALFTFSSSPRLQSLVQPTVSSDLEQCS